MSDEPQPLRLKPRPPPPAGPAAEPETGTLQPAPAPGAGQGEGIGRLRLKARLNLPDAALTQAVPDIAVAEPPVPPPAPPSGGFPLPEPVAAADPESEDLPKFKLRPKITVAQYPPQQYKGAPPPPLPPSASSTALPRQSSSPPPPPSSASPPLPPLPRSGGAARPFPIPGHRSQSVPPMSILAAPPPPPPGSVAEPPGPPGSMPRLSLSTAPDLSGSKGTHVPGTEGLPKVGGKPVVAKPGKTAAVLRKRPALGPLAKVGLTVVVIAIGVGGFYSYRIFFPAPSPVMKIRLPAIAKPVAPSSMKLPDGQPKGALPDELAEKGQEQAKADEVTPGQVPTPTPNPGANVVETVMADSAITNDVKVSSTPIDAAMAASAAFRAFVAGATIGGVFQGAPSRALINGTIVREGQVVDSGLGIAFERIDPGKKVIYFKDYTGAEVSKNY